MTDESEPTKEELAQRVDQLEATVAKMMPNRRQALAGMGAVLGGAALGGTASGSTGTAGDVGTDSDRPDVFADAVDANSLSTGSVGIADATQEAETYSLADDEAVETYANSGSHSFVWIIGGGTDYYANVTLKFSQFETIFLASGINDASNSDLTGTAGPDGNLNISQNSATLHIENRTGSQMDVDVFTLSR